MLHSKMISKKRGYAGMPTIKDMMIIKDIILQFFCNGNCKNITSKNGGYTTIWSVPSQVYGWTWLFIFQQLDTWTGDFWDVNSGTGALEQPDRFYEHWVTNRHQPCIMVIQFFVYSEYQKPQRGFSTQTSTSASRGHAFLWNSFASFLRQTDLRPS